MTGGEEVRGGGEGSDRGLRRERERERGGEEVMSVWKGASCVHSSLQRALQSTQTLSENVTQRQGYMIAGKIS